MAERELLLQNNREWAQGMGRRDPGLFKRLSLQQTPKYMWIGCSDSRVPANQILGLDDEGPAWFCQREDGMVLCIQEDGAPRAIPIHAGEMFLPPPRRPDPAGRVIERKRLAHERDGLMWFCEHCNHELY